MRGHVPAVRNTSPADGDGCDTRAEVLIAEATVAPTADAHCTLTGGSWHSYYDNATYTNAGQLEIDHLVPLAEAWGSGANAWTSATLEAFANDLTDVRMLVAAEASLNDAKGAQQPGEWVPPHAGALCRYIEEWIAVKTRWALSIDPAEQEALGRYADSCEDTNLTVVFANPAIDEPAAAGPALASFVGMWRAHGFSLQLDAEGNGTAVWSAGPCTETAGLCTARAAIIFTAEPDSASGTFRSVDYTDADGNSLTVDPIQNEDPAVGSKLRLEPVENENDVLSVMFDPPIQGGNPYLCGPDAAPAWRHQCNA